MEMSLRVFVHLLFCVLVCELHSTAAGLVIRHNENFGSGLVLECYDGLFLLPSGVSFQRNGTNITGNSGGMLRYPLNQTNEGRFTCTHDDQVSEPITLAGIRCTL